MLLFYVPQFSMSRNQKKTSLQVRQGHLYSAIKHCAEEYGYPVEVACEILQVSRSAYYNWISGKLSVRRRENEHIAEIAEQIHIENPDKGYRRIRDDLGRFYDIEFHAKKPNEKWLTDVTPFHSSSSLRFTI